MLKEIVMFSAHTERVLRSHALYFASLFPLTLGCSWLGHSREPDPKKTKFIGWQVAYDITGMENSNQDSVALWYTNWSTVEDRRPRHRPTDTWWINFWQKWKVEKEQFYNKWYWKNWISICKKLNFDPYIKINSKWITDLM